MNYKNKLGLIVLMLMLLVSLSGFSKSVTRANYKIIYKGKYQFVYLFVDGKDYGRLKRGSAKRVIYIATGETKEIVYLNLKKKSSSKCARKYLIVKYSGTYKKVFITINGKEYGVIRQENERRFLLQASIKYKIVLEAGGNKSSKTVYLSHLADRYVNFFAPSE